MEMEESVVLVSLCCFFAHICSRPSLLLSTDRVPRQTERSRREHLRLRFDPFSKLRHQSTPYCCLNSADVLLLRHRAAGRSQTRRLLRAEFSHQSVHLRFVGLVQCTTQRYYRFVKVDILHLLQFGAHQPRSGRGP